MSSSAAAAKKRKLSAVDNDNFSSLKRKEPHSPERNLSGPINCLDLPLPLWAEVFHFLEYKDARACLLVCRFVANQVSKHVKHLHVMRSCELEVRSARRFPNVVDININCLLRQDDHDDDSTQRIVPESVGRIVPFLSAFRHQAEEEGGEICAAVSFINIAKLSSFENEPFDCDPRPTSNQTMIS